MEKERLTKMHSALKLPQSISSECIHRLFHYTNYKSKAEIVGDKKIVFKLSHVNEFLDKNEGFQILEPYYHACGDLYENGVIDKEFFLVLREIKEKDLLDSFSNSWVLCFSKNANSAFMKRRYAAGDGWIIGLPFDLLSDACSDFLGTQGSIGLYEVEYSFNKVFRFIRKSLKKYYDFYSSGSSYGYETKKEIFSHIVSWLVAQSLVYKSSIYKPEEEIRLICNFASGFSSWKKQDNAVQFKSSTDGYKDVTKMILTKRCLTYE